MMKKRLKHSEVVFFGQQTFLYLTFIGIWSLVIFSIEKNLDAAWESIRITSSLLLILWIVFGLNNYLLVPKIYESKKHPKIKRWLFWLLNLGIILLLNREILLHGPDGSQVVWNEATRIGTYIFHVVLIVINYAMIGLAIGRHYYLHQKQLKRQLAEERQRNTEAELAWLKNQLNPHFLFNTLNNISSLTQIDADMAQDKIGRLSDLLRYALYETRSERVALGCEVEFMQNYIDLMSLRCGPNVVITTDFEAVDGALPIAPMLFLSPIENAFKHGVSSSKPSFIHISLSVHAGSLAFSCENSNYPKGDSNRSGSGIGTENLRRRLQLLYPDRHDFVCGPDGDTYYVNIRLWNN